MGQGPTRDSLSDTLRAIADEDSPISPSPDVEQHLRIAVRAIAKARRKRVYVVAMAVAATLLLATIRSNRPPAPLSPAPPVPVEVATDFLPLMYAAVSMTEARIVRLEVPRVALIAFGLSPIDAMPTSSETVLADVLVGEDGLARAVRFIQRQ